MAIRGIIPAILTAFDGEGALDPVAERNLVDRLVAQGVHGLFLGGSTGEFPLLSEEERIRLAELVMEAARGRVPVLVHVGAIDPRVSLRLARHAARAGAAAVSSLPPLYYRVGEAEVLEHYRRIAAAAEPLPFYAYHIPELTGVPLTTRLLEGLLEVPGFAGLKWSDPDLAGLERAVAMLGERADMLSGKDEVLLGALALGARGAIGSSYNFLAPWCVGIWDAVTAGNVAAARPLQRRVSDVIDLVSRAGPGPSPWKAAASWAGADCGAPRPPLPTIAGDRRAALEAALTAAGLPRGGLPPFSLS